MTMGHTLRITQEICSNLWICEFRQKFKLSINSFIEFFCLSSNNWTFHRNLILVITFLLFDEFRKWAYFLRNPESGYDPIYNWNNFFSYLYFIFPPFNSHHYDFQGGKGFREPTIVMFHSKRLRWCSAERASSSKI